jgi:hypothetical protein
MGWLVKPQRIYLDLVVSWLRSEIARLTHVLKTIEDTSDYHDEFVHESIKDVEVALRRIRKFTEAN